MENTGNKSRKLGVGMALNKVLLSLGFKTIKSPSFKKQYYTHFDTGIQVLLNSSNYTIKILDKYGFNITNPARKITKQEIQECLSI